MTEDVWAHLPQLTIVPTDDLLPIKYGLVEQPEGLTMTAAHDLERLVPRAPVTVDRKIIVEACCLDNSQSLHNCETCSIDQRKCLIWKSGSNGPSCLEICSYDYLDVHAAAQSLFQEEFGYFSAVSTIEQ
jgi:hypothetical protein